MQADPILKLEDAVREHSFVKMALAGPAGAGKTYTSLKLAGVLAEGGLIVVIDSQHRQAEKQAGKRGLPPFKIITLPSFSPQMYRDALKLAYKAQAAIVIIDSLTHAWEGEGGVLEIAKAKGNTFQDGWNTASPLHQELINSILAFPAHTICTLRSHMAYEVVTDSRGKAVPRRLGMQPIQRKGVEYEFDFYGSMNHEHALHIEKSVIDSLSRDMDIPLPGVALGETLLAWSQGLDVDADLSDGLHAIA